jgi:hypothetical protein
MLFSLPDLEDFFPRFPPEDLGYERQLVIVLGIAVSLP